MKLPGAPEAASWCNHVVGFFLPVSRSWGLMSNVLKYIKHWWDWSSAHPEPGSVCLSVWHLFLAIVAASETREVLSLTTDEIFELNQKTFLLKQCSRTSQNSDGCWWLAHDMMDMFQPWVVVCLLQGSGQSCWLLRRKYNNTSDRRRKLSRLTVNLNCTGGSCDPDWNSC